MTSHVVDLIAELPRALAALRTDLVAFGSFLETASLADELGAEPQDPS